MACALCSYIALGKVRPVAPTATRNDVVNGGKRKLLMCEVAVQHAGGWAAVANLLDNHSGRDWGAQHTASHYSADYLCHSDFKAGYQADKSRPNPLFSSDRERAAIELLAKPKPDDLTPLQTLESLH